MWNGNVWAGVHILIAMWQWKVLKATLHCHFHLTCHFHFWSDGSPLVCIVTYISGSINFMHVFRQDACLKLHVYKVTSFVTCVLCFVQMHNLCILTFYAVQMTRKTTHPLSTNINIVPHMMTTIVVTAV